MGISKNVLLQQGMLRETLTSLDDRGTLILESTIDLSLDPLTSVHEPKIALLSVLCQCSQSS